MPGRNRRRCASSAARTPSRTSRPSPQPLAQASGELGSNLAYAGTNAKYTRSRISATSPREQQQQHDWKKAR